MSIIKLDSNKNANVLEAIFGGDKSRVKSFLCNDFQRRPVVIRGCSDRLQSIISELNDLSVKDMLEESASDEIQVWLKTDKNDTSMNGTKAPAGLQSFKTPDPGQGKRELIINIAFA